MLGQQFLGPQPQGPPSKPYSRSRRREEGAGLLGNQEIQSVRTPREKTPLIGDAERHKLSSFAATIFNGQPSSARLEALKKQKFTLEGKQERIAKALAALSQETTIKLPKEVWRYIAEDPDLEDQF